MINGDLKLEKSNQGLKIILEMKLHNTVIEKGSEAAQFLMFNQLFGRNMRLILRPSTLEAISEQSAEHVN